MSRHRGESAWTLLLNGPCLRSEPNRPHSERSLMLLQKCYQRGFCYLLV